MALRFGTSGVRGLISEMTDRECFLYTVAFIRALRAKQDVERVAVAGDHRSSTPRILGAVAFALQSEGLSVDYCGAVPTPLLAHYAMARKHAAVMVTGSHIPDDRNGLKYYLPWGETLKPDEQEITTQYAALNEADHGAGHFDGSGMLREGLAPELGPPLEQATDEYVARYTGFFPKACLEGVKLVCYQHSSVLRDVLPRILTALGAEVVPVGRSDAFVAVDTEAVENTDQLAAWVREQRADGLVSADGDGDRPLLVTEAGKLVRGDVLGILVSDYLGADAVVTPISSNTALEKFGRFFRIERTRIGSPYVIATMQEIRDADQGPMVIVGYEANGGFFTGSDVTRVSGGTLTALPTRDAALPLVAALCAASERRVKLSRLVDTLPPRFTASGLIRDFPPEEGREVVDYLRQGGPHTAEIFFAAAFGSVTDFDTTDGIRMTFRDGRILHLRPSGNAPEFRCYTEANAESQAVKANDTARRILEERLRPLMKTTPPGFPEHRAFANIAMMDDADSGMDVVVVTTTGPGEAAFWQHRLEAGRGQVARRDALILAVHEDWADGAGNGLGTLYALRCAADLARSRNGIDLMARLRDGASLGLYHTAGKGTRLAPLPATECNNKCAVKLPGIVELDGVRTPITLLEAVIRQTGVYASCRRRRVSVFWGDQVFIPTREVHYTPTHHVDILVRLEPQLPDAETWQQRGLDKYGMVAVAAKGNAVQIDKVGRTIIADAIADGTIDASAGIGVSLGSFSLSAAFTEALVAEFAPELEAKAPALDADPHFWMALTLECELYASLMQTKGMDRDAAVRHHQRMADFKRRFGQDHRGGRIFGAVDVGADALWWDYGQLALYHRTNLRMLEDSEEAEAMRCFFRIGDPQEGSRLGAALTTDARSLLLDCRIDSGTVTDSILVGVTAKTVALNRTVVIDSVAPEFRAENALVYHAIDDRPVTLPHGAARADVIPPQGDPLRLTTALNRNGKDCWNCRLPDNPASYAEVHKRNVGDAEDRATARRAAVRERIEQDLGL